MGVKKNKINPHTQTDEEILRLKYERDLADIRALKKSDEKEFENAISGKERFDWSGITRLVAGDLSQAGFYQSQNIYGVTPMQIMMALRNPTFPANWRIMVMLSNYLYLTSGYYKRIIDHFADMSTYSYDVDVSIKSEPKDVHQFRKKYDELLFLLDKMNLPHELSKIMQVVFREGAYFGYAYENQDDFFFNKLDMSVCRAFILQDGVYNVEVNLAMINDSNFHSFPPEAQQAWRDYIYKNKSVPGIDKMAPPTNYALTGIPQAGNQLPAMGMYPQAYIPMAGIWYELDPKKAICIKMNESINAIVPYFIFLFQDILDIKEYKDIQRTHTELENYRIIALKIPLKKDANEVDDFAVSGDTILDNIQTSTSVTDKNIAIFPTALDPEAITFPQRKDDKDTVAAAIDNLNSDAGVDRHLFNGGNSATLLVSIENDATMVYKLLRQVSRWLNRRHKLMGFGSRNYRFSVEFLDTTVHNRDKHVDKLLKACQFGIPLKTKLGAALGLSPARLIGEDYLENIALKLGERWTTLKSTHTGDTGIGDRGRPLMEIENLTPAGLESRE